MDGGDSDTSVDAGTGDTASPDAEQDAEQDVGEADVQPDPDAEQDAAETDVEQDSGDDASEDAGEDAEIDAAEDAATDAAEDAATDTAEDAATDTAEDAATDAAEDAATDAAEDAATDTAEDAATDAAEDAATDTAEDAATDAAEDATTDTAEDAATDAVEDVATDAGEDAVSDAGMDAGADTAPDAEDDTGSGVYGLAERPANPSCFAGPAPVLDVEVEVVDRYPELTFTFPVGIRQAPDDPNTLYVIEKPGRLVAVDVAAGTATSTVVLDIESRVNTSTSANDERGFLGADFHPDFAENGRLYVHYSARVSASHYSRISYFTLDDDGTFDEASESVVLQFPQPASNHNGGDLHFGPDGYLYASFGDGGGANDTFGHGQRADTLFGTIIRIDVDSGDPYAIPDTNPFADGVDGAPEVWAWGLRNPWRMSFDPVTGELWTGDVGQNLWEEVDIIVRGGNYGWPIREGNSCFNGDSRCATDETLRPVVEYDHSQGISISGGVVYRGSEIPELYGRYLYADYVSGNVWAVGYDDDGEPEPELILTLSANPSSFGVDADGEVYIADYGRGIIYRLARRGDPPESTIAERLSETGCMDPLDPSQPGSMLIPYEPAAPFWSDGADKERWFAIPDGTSITLDERGDFVFPVGAVTVKNFRIDGQIIETRLFVRHEDGNWAGYSYRWNDDQTEAFLLDGQELREVGDQTWIYPSRGQCVACHTNAAGRSLGLEMLQLGGDWLYPSGTLANQLDTLVHIGVVDDAGAPDVGVLPTPFDESEGTLEERALAYLHTNCASCHQDGGPARGNVNLYWGTDDLGICNTVPEHGVLGIDGARIVDGNNPETSVLYERVNRRDENAMPPIGSTVVDTEGVALLEAFIASGFCEGVVPAEICDNDADDDGDGDTDCADNDCDAIFACDPDAYTCARPFEVDRVPTTISGSTAGAASNGSGSCGGGSAGDHVVAFTPPSSGTYCADTRGSGYDTLLHVRSSCGSSLSQLDCNDDIGSGNLLSQVEFSTSSTVYIYVDGYDGEGDYQLSINSGACP